MSVPKQDASADGGLLKPLRDFLRLEAAGGMVLMAAAVLAMIIANSPLAPWYNRLLELPFVVKLGDFGIGKPLLLWINDGLMAVFFFLVGMELKREIVEGHLAQQFVEHGLGAGVGLQFQVQQQPAARQVQHLPQLGHVLVAPLGAEP